MLKNPKGLLAGLFHNYMLLPLFALILGVLFYFATYKLLPTRYLSTLAVTIDLNSLPAIKEPQLVAMGYNTILTSPTDLMEILEDVFFDPKTQHTTLNLPLFVDDFVIKDKFDRRILEMESVMDNFIIKVDFPVTGLGNELGTKLIKAINRSVQKKNESLSLAHEKASKVIMDTHLEKFKDLYQIFNESVPSYENALLVIKANLYQIEYDLRKIAEDKNISAASIESASQSKNESKDILLNNFVGNDIEANGKINNLPKGDDSYVMIEPILKLISLLKSHNAIDAKTIAHYQQRITAEIARGKVTNDYFTDKKSIRLATTFNLHKSAIDFATPIDRTKYFLPMLELNKSYFEASLLKGSIEKKRSFRGVYAVFCLLSSFLLIGAGWLFLGPKRNKKLPA